MKYRAIITFESGVGLQSVIGDLEDNCITVEKIERID